MKIGIIGRGSVASALFPTLGQRHDVRLGVRTVSDPPEAPIGDVARWADVVLLATPWTAEEEVCQAITDHVAGKAVIDATNPVGMRNGRLDLVHQGPGSAAETLQACLPDAHVVKCFNQIGAEFMEDAGKLSSTPVMFAASDDAAAKNIALRLATEAGFEAADGGPLSNAGHLESLAMIWIWCAANGPLGRTFGFSLSHAQSKDP